MHERTHNETAVGRWGWLGIASFVVAWDMLAEETLTHCFRRGLENPQSRPLVYGALALTSMHLCHKLPDAIDPFYYVERRLLGHKSFDMAE